MSRAHLLRDDMAVCAGLAAVAGAATYILIPRIGPLLVKAGRFGKDLNKPGQPVVPESLGLVTAALYLVTLFCFIPWRFGDFLRAESMVFSCTEFAVFVSALLSISCMALLGFADDVLDLRWRDKLWIPMAATIPLLMVYYVTRSPTTVVVPPLLESFVGAPMVDLGFLYYLYMGCLSIFSTNAINIYAGVNGLEAGQSLVIALSILAHNLVQLYVMGSTAMQHENHAISVFLILPFVGVTTALLWHNWCPARAFVGDTFCYFAGMTFAVAGILGHFSKTMILFFLPQTFNFLLSVPQLFKLVPCPRHRMPRLNPESGNLEKSYAEFKESDLRFLGRLVVAVFSMLGFVSVERSTRENATWLKVSNMTLINVALRFGGPAPEGILCRRLLILQTVSTLFAFAIRYGLSRLFFERVE